MVCVHGRCCPSWCLRSSACSRHHMRPAERRSVHSTHSISILEAASASSRAGRSHHPSAVAITATQQSNQTTQSPDIAYTSCTQLTSHCTPTRPRLPSPAYEGAGDPEPRQQAYQGPAHHQATPARACGAGIRLFTHTSSHPGHPGHTRAQQRRCSSCTCCTGCCTGCCCPCTGCAGDGALVCVGVLGDGVRARDACRAQGGGEWGVNGGGRLV